MKTLLVTLLIVALGYAQTDPFLVDGVPRLSGAGYITTNCSRLQLGEEAPFPLYWTDEVNNYLYPNLRLLQSQRDLPNFHRRTYNFPTIGCVDATFNVLPNIPAAFAKGMFVAGKSYQSFIRFSGFDQETQNLPDAKGMAIKVLGVTGNKLLPGYEADQMVDFLLNAYPVLKENNETVLAATVMARTQLSGGGDRGRAGLANVYPNVIATDAAERNNNTVSSVLMAPFFSVSPYQLGTFPSPAVKYRVYPCLGAGTNTGNQTAFPVDHLSQDLATRLAAGTACFVFQVQVQVDACKQPINDLNVEWLEADSPYVTIATINITSQVPQNDLSLTCKHASFNPWRTLPEHRPLGSANRARLFAYMNGQNLRLSLNLALDPFAVPAKGAPPGWQYWNSTELGINANFQSPAIKTNYPFNPQAGNFQAPFTPPTPCPVKSCP